MGYDGDRVAGPENAVDVRSHSVRVGQQPTQKAQRALVSSMWHCGPDYRMTTGLVTPVAAARLDGGDG